MAERSGVGNPLEGQFRGIGLADDDGSGIKQALDDMRVAGGGRAAEDLATIAGGQSGIVLDGILDQQGDTREGAAQGFCRALTCQLEHGLTDGIDTGIEAMVLADGDVQ